MSSVLERVNGVARCPYDPRHNSTAVVTESGELYAATVIDFSGRDPVIYRSLGGMPPLRTAQYNSKWLNGRTARREMCAQNRTACPQLKLKTLIICVFSTLMSISEISSSSGCRFIVFHFACFTLWLSNFLSDHILKHFR